MRNISKMDNIPSQSHSPEVKIKSRHIQIFLVFLGFLCCFGIRAVPSIGLVAMTKSNTANPDIADYNWSDGIQNLIFSSFLWGFVATQIPASELVQRFGSHKFFSFAVGICGIVTILIPAAAKYGGWQAVIILRILTGAVQGVVPPCIYMIISKWVPVGERARAGSCIYSGGLLGIVIAMLSCGAISKSVLGWPSCFYIWGGVATLWAVIYLFIGKQSPPVHPTISLDGNEYMESSPGLTDTVKTLKTPWIAILTSTPVWALLVAQCAYTWGGWMILTKIPTYMASVLDYNILENGIMTAIPYLVACVLSFPISFTCDKMVENGHVSLKVMRKIANSVGLFIPALALIGFTFVTSEDRILAVVILIVSMGFNVCICSGFLINHIDLSPNFSGILMGITNAAANIFGIMAPLICGVIVPDVTNIYQWRKVFFLSAVIYIIGTIVFLLFGDVTIQPWNESTSHTKVHNEISIRPNTTITAAKIKDRKKIDSS